MRLAYVCADPGVPVFGSKGCSVHVQESLRALLAAGAEVELIACRRGGAPPPDLQKLPIHALLPDGQRPRLRSAADVEDWNRHLARQLAAAGSFDAVYERYALFSHGALEEARRAGLPTLLEVNAPLVQEQLRHRRPVDAELAEASSARAFTAASLLLPVSERLRDHLLSSGVPADRIRVCPNAVNLARIHPRVPPRLPMREDELVVGFVGSLRPWHAVNDLVDALLELSRRDVPVRLLIVGDGPGRDPLHHRIRKADLGDRVRLLGAVPPDEIPALLTSMHVGVAPYRDDGRFYFSPLKVYEYLAAGRPVVASRVGSLAQVVRHEREGLLYPPGDASALADCLERLARDAPLRRVLARRARARAEQGGGWNRLARRILSWARPAGAGLRGVPRGAA